MATKKKKKSYIDQVLSGEYEYSLVNMNKTSSKKTSTNNTTSSSKKTSSSKSYVDQVIAGEYETTLYNQAKKRKEQQSLTQNSKPSSLTNNIFTRTSQRISSFLLGKDDEEDIAPVKPTVTTPTYTPTTNEDGYTLIGKSYGDYFYQDYTKMKDYPIVQKDGNFYILNSNATTTEEKYLPFAPRGRAGGELIDPEASKKEYEEAVINGYINRQKSSGLGAYDLVKLDSVNLTQDERKEYKEDLIRQREEYDEYLKRKNKVRYGGAGFKGTLGELEYYKDNLTENIDEKVVEPIKNAPESYKMGKMSEEMGMEAYKSMMGEENNYEELKKEYDKYVMFNQDIATDDSMISQSIQSMPNQVGGFVNGVKNSGVGAILGAIIGSGVGYFTGNVGTGAVTGAKYGGGAGYTKGQMEYTYKLEAGLQYQALIEMGVPEDIAREEAKKVGTINALIEGGESLVDLFTFGQASAGKELLKQGLIKRYGLDVVESWALNSAVINPLSEGVEEGLQEYSSIESEKRATEKAGIERDDSQDAERIWDSAKVGAFSGLLFGGATAVTTKGVNAGVNKITNNKTTYTQNEQAVIDKEVENRIEEAEKSGKELTTKEKNEIKAEVIEDLENGYISTDSIENTLGGDTYTSLNEIRENKTKIEQEINELENKPYAQLTVKENDRLKALREELSTIDTNTLETQLRSEMDGKIANDSYLQRSYVEKYNRSQKFTRNESETSDNTNVNDFYTSMEEANVNNTKKTHDFSSFVSNIIKDKGIKARAVNYDILVKEGRIYKDTDGQYKFIENSKKTDRVANINGFKENGVLNINMQSSKAFEMTVGHELGEFIKDSDSTAYQSLKDIAIELGKADGSFSDNTLKSYVETYGKLTDDATDEYVNDKLGELFDNDQFVTRISENRSLLRKIIDELKYLVEYATAGSSEKRKLVSLQHKLENKFREAYKKTDLTKEQQSKPRYSITENQELYNKVANERQLVHLTNDISELLKSGVTRDTGMSIAMQKKGQRYIGYGQYAVEFQPEIIDYAQEIYQGDGATNRGNKKGAPVFNSLVEAIENDPSTRLIQKYNEVFLSGNVPLTNYIKSVTAPSNASSEIINMLNDAGIEVKFYNAPEWNGKINDNPKVSYSLDTEGKLVDSEGNGVTLEAGETGTHGTLMAIHNLTENKMRGIIDLGGFPVPSIAVTKVNNVGSNQFGDMTVLFDKETINPANKKNEVYDRDVWTPTFPRVEYDINTKSLSRIRKIVGGYGNFYLSDANSILNNIEDKINGYGLENAIDEVKKSDAFKYVYLKNKDANFEPITMTTEDQLSSYYSNELLREFAQEYGEIPHWYDISSEQRQDIIDKFKEKWKPLLEERRDKLIAEEQAKAEPRQYMINIINSNVETNLSKLDSLGGQDDFIRNLNTIQENNAVTTKIDKEATKQYLNDNIDQAEYEKWVDEQFKDITSGKGIRNDKDTFTPSGNRRSFKQTHEPYDLANIVKYMTKQKTVAGEEGFGAGSGFGTIQAQMSTRFKSIDEIRQYADEKIVPSAEEHDLTKPYSDAIHEDMASLVEYYKFKNDKYSYPMDNSGYALNDFAGYKKQDISSLKRALQENQFNVEDIPMSLLTKIVDDVNALKTMPTDYFEAKPQRAVGLDEVQAIVIPNTTDAEFKQLLQDNGISYYEYDPSIEGDKQRVIEQFDNLKFSLGIQNDIAPTNPNLTYAEDVRLEVEEAIAPLKQEIAELKETLAPVQKQVEYTQPTKEELDNLMSLQETGGTEYANTFFELRDKYGQANLYKGINQYKKAPDTYTAPVKGEQIDTVVNGKAVTEAELPMLEQQYEEDFKHIDESNIPAETEEIAPVDAEPITTTKSLFETRDYENVGNPKTKAYMYENPEVKPFFQQEAQYMLNDLKNSTKGEKWYNDDLYYETSGEQGYFGTTRQTTDDIAELLDGMDGRFKYTREQIEKGLNAIIKDEGSENNAVSKRIEFYLDQRLRNGYTNIDGIDIPANPEYISMLEEKQVTEYSDQAYQEWLKTLEDVDMPVENVDNSIDEIAPIKKPRETIAEIRPSKTRADDHGYELLKVKDISKEQKATNEEIAEILDKEPVTESDRNKRKWAILKANVFDKGAVIEDLSLKKKNRELMGKWDFTLTSEARGQNIIGKGHFRFDPATKQKVQTSKSLNDIVQEVGNTGLTKQFYEYMYHKHNIDRMTLEERFGTENKAVIGDSVTAQESRKVVSRYETQHPEFMDFAQDVYDYLNADKQELVDNGVISQEASDLWSEMYPHYVPIRRVTDKGLDINVPLDTGRTGINAPVKQATGGNADILPLFDTMAMRTLQTQRATAKNSFGIELKNTLGADTVITTPTVDEVIDSIDAQEELLQEGKKGAKPTFTVFENGEKVTFTITKDMYDAMKPLSDSSILSKTIKPLNVASNIRRGLITEYNPVFMLTNAIKDVQDVFINSQHSARTYANIPEAYAQILSKGYWYQEYVANGGEQNSYFDSQENTFKPEAKGFKKVITTPFRAISKINNFIEMTPRLAEYMASRKQGKSVEVSMLDASRVTTNFKAGGDVTKFLNRNGFTFLNASVQGFNQQVRNFREANANGFKGWVKLASKFTLAGVPALILNNLVWEDDEEYEELSDYVKQNYYIVGKYGDGKFIRIPKGRTVAVIQNGFEQMEHLVTGDEEADFKTFFDLFITNLAPSNPADNNIIAPIIQVAKNETWYGEDLVPTRLQNRPVEEQYDESTDELSKWIGETFGVSPYKVNYLLDQYSGGLGDVFLPMMTPEAESGDDKFIDKLFAPVKSKFTADSVMNNQNVSDLYETSEQLTIQANKTNATDEDILKNKYINSVKAEMNELYAEKREIQNSDLPDSEKYERTREIQREINNLSKNALSEYENGKIYTHYAQVGDRHYRINDDGEWIKINDKQLENQSEVTNALGISKDEYWSNKDEYDYAYKNPGKYGISKTVGGYDSYKKYTGDLYDIKADKDSNGDSISGSRKKKVLKYINDLDLNEVERAILFKMEYPSFDDYNYEIIEYLNNRDDISYEEMVNILTELDMDVDSNGNISW